MTAKHNRLRACVHFLQHNSRRSSDQGVHCQLENAALCLGQHMIAAPCATTTSLLARKTSPISQPPSRPILIVRTLCCVHPCHLKIFTFPSFYTAYILHQQKSYITPCHHGSPLSVLPSTLCRFGGATYGASLQVLPCKSVHWDAPSTTRHHADPRTGPYRFLPGASKCRPHHMVCELLMS